MDILICILGWIILIWITFVLALCVFNKIGGTRFYFRNKPVSYFWIFPVMCLLPKLKGFTMVEKRGEHN